MCIMELGVWSGSLRVKNNKREIFSRLESDIVWPICRHAVIVGVKVRLDMSGLTASDRIYSK